MPLGEYFPLTRPSLNLCSLALLCVIRSLSAILQPLVALNLRRASRYNVSLWVSINSQKKHQKLTIKYVINAPFHSVWQRTDNKPLLKVGDKPILETVILRFIKAGFHDFYISTFYKSNVIKEYFQNGPCRLQLPPSWFLMIPGCSQMRPEYNTKEYESIRQLKTKKVPANLEICKDARRKSSRLVWLKTS